MSVEFNSIEGLDMTSTNPWRKAVLSITSVLVALAGSQVADAQDDSAATGAPFKKILVIYLASSFDSRRYLETEIVKALAEEGTTAVRSTSMMNSKVPVTRETFVAMVDEIDADAVLVSQIADLQTKGTVVDMNPQATYNFRPTWYYNVWSVDLTEYVAPQAVDYDYKLSLATQLYSVQAEKAIWAMRSDSNVHQAFDQGPDYKIYVKEANVIVKQLRKSKMIDR